MADGAAAGPGPQVRAGLLLVTLIAAYLVSAVTQTRWGGAIHVAFVVAIVLLAVRRSWPWSPAAWLTAGLGLVSAGAAAAGAVSGDRVAEGIADVWNALVLLLAVVMIIDRVLRVNQVTAQSIYGALSAYLLIGLMFASCFGAIGDLVAGPFFTHGQPASDQTLQYFSFTTLTTLGYGDFTAGGSLGRAVAVLEALTGQVFLATLVARLVSAYRASGRRPPADGRLTASGSRVSGWRCRGAAGRPRGRRSRARPGRARACRGP